MKTIKDVFYVGLYIGMAIFLIIGLGFWVKLITKIFMFGYNTF